MAGLAGLALAGSSGAAYALHLKPTIGPATVSVIPAPLPAPPSTSNPPPSVTALPGGESGGASEGLSVSVLPGGPLRVSPPELTLVAGDDRTRSTEVGEIEVVDPRGSLAGWVLTARVAGRSDVDARVEVIPGPPLVVDGDPIGLVPGARADLGDRHAVRLLSSRSGHGGGTYRLRVSVRVEGDEGRVRVPLRLDLD